MGGKKRIKKKFKNYILATFICQILQVLITSIFRAIWRVDIIIIIIIPFYRWRNWSPESKEMASFFLARRSDLCSICLASGQALTLCAPLLAENKLGQFR